MSWAQRKTVVIPRKEQATLLVLKGTQETKVQNGMRILGPKVVQVQKKTAIVHHTISGQPLEAYKARIQAQRQAQIARDEQGRLEALEENLRAKVARHDLTVDQAQYIMDKAYLSEASSEDEDDLE